MDSSGNERPPPNDQGGNNEEVERVPDDPIKAQVYMRLMQTVNAGKEDSSQSSSNLLKKNEHPLDPVPKKPSFDRPKAGIFDQAPWLCQINVFHPDGSPYEALNAGRDWEDFLSDPRLLEKVGRTFEKPLPIQTHVAPLVKAGKDLMLRSDGGYGRSTAVFLPLIEELLPFSDARRANGVQESIGCGWAMALIIAPSVAAACDLFEEIMYFVPRGNDGKPLLQVTTHRNHIDATRVATLGTDILVVTVPALEILLRDGCITLSSVRYLVLDAVESTRFGHWSNFIEKFVETGKFTKNDNIQAITLSSKDLGEDRIQTLLRPGFLRVHVSTPRVQIARQDFVRVQPGSTSYQVLCEEIHKEGTRGTLVVFTDTSTDAENLHRCLSGDFPTYNIGLYLPSTVRDERSRTADEEWKRENERQKEEGWRRETIQRFREGALDLIVSIHSVERKIDAPHLLLEIHFKLDDCKENFVHRVAQCGRMRTGESLTIFSWKDERSIRAIHEALQAINVNCAGLSAVLDSIDQGRRERQEEDDRRWRDEKNRREHQGRDDEQRREQEQRRMWEEEECYSDRERREEEPRRRWNDDDINTDHEEDEQKRRWSEYNEDYSSSWPTFQTHNDRGERLDQCGRNWEEGDFHLDQDMRMLELRRRQQHVDNIRAAQRNEEERIRMQNIYNNRDMERRVAEQPVRNRDMDNRSERQRQLDMEKRRHEHSEMHRLAIEEHQRKVQEKSRMKEKEREQNERSRNHRGDYGS